MMNSRQRPGGALFFDCGIVTYKLLSDEIEKASLFPR
jgi:hypothetical protein